MDNSNQQFTDHSTAYDHSSDEFNFLLRSKKISKLLQLNEVVIAIELAIVSLFAGLAYLLML